MRTSRGDKGRPTGTGARWFVGALVMACLLLAGPSGSNRAYTAGPLPAGAAGGTAEIDAYAPQAIGLQKACVGGVERIRDYLRYRYGLV
ncbi:hypothetical protein [Streptomyces sp. NPDC086838]|uniref:hypothetical protein n=1 Tax=Streptomyces sp. NPDC086838 TaxID=3365762 RepID=UPI003817A73D